MNNRRTSKKWVKIEHWPESHFSGNIPGDWKHKFKDPLEKNPIECRITVTSVRLQTDTLACKLPVCTPTNRSLILRPFCSVVGSSGTLLNNTGVFVTREVLIHWSRTRPESYGMAAEHSWEGCSHVRSAGLCAALSLVLRVQRSRRWP